MVSISCFGKFVRSTVRSFGTVFLVLFCLFSLIASCPAHADQEKLVRVGWFDSSFYYVDEHGRSKGYAYEYEQKLITYTNWKVEYVKGSWSDLFKRLKAGEIDVLADVSFTQERKGAMLFSKHSMGTENYFLLVDAERNVFDPNDLSTFNGKRIAVNLGSIQETMFKSWEASHGVKTQLVPLSKLTREYGRMLAEGRLDGVIGPGSFEANVSHSTPILHVGSSEYFFAVRLDRADLKADLDNAMDKILAVNPFYNQQLYEKYFNKSGIYRFLSTSEREWLKRHGAIRIGYADDYLPFCAQDAQTCVLKGFLKDFISHVSLSMPGEAIEFKTVPFSSFESSIEALKAGTVDAVFPIGMQPYDAQVRGLWLTNPVIGLEMFAITRAKDYGKLNLNGEVRIAINNKGNPYIRSLIQDNFPKWKLFDFYSLEECLKGVADGRVDVFLVNNYRLSALGKILEKYGLIAVSAGTTGSFSFAVAKSNRTFYSLLEHLTTMMTTTERNASLTRNLDLQHKVSFTDFVRDNFFPVLGGLIAVFSLILYLMWLRMKSARVATERLELIEATQLDPLTGLYTDAFFKEYAYRIYRQNPTRPMDAFVLDMDQFHLINELKGFAFGDKVLQTLADEIKAFVRETDGIAARQGADRFLIYCAHQDRYAQIYERFVRSLSELSTQVNILLRMGVMPWKPGLEPVSLLERALTANNRARGKFGQRLVVFDKAVHEREVYEQGLLNDLHRALENNEFEVYYQPKFDVRVFPPRLYGAEALVRWNHPSLGMVIPGDFIPLFERNGQIGLIDRHVWAQAARQIAQWREQFGVTIPVSVNLSRVDLFDPELEQTLIGLVRENGLEFSSLRLEITESAYTENSDQVIKVLESLHQKGFTIEMDDFGSGYSSLNMLSDMPIDILKIDQGFIRKMGQGDKNLRMVELILDIARSMKLLVVAEGVELEKQLKYLKQLGCDVVQGYLFSKPVPAQAFEKFLKQDSASQSV